MKTKNILTHCPGCHKYSVMFRTFEQLGSGSMGISHVNKEIGHVILLDGPNHRQKL